MVKTFVAIALAFVLIASVGSLPADTVGYPKGKPLFTIEVPDGWEVHYGRDGSLTIQTANADIVAVFDGRTKGVTNSATAKEAVTAQKNATAETTGYTDFREITSVQKMQLSPQVEAVGAKYHAKFPSGEPCIYLVAVFAPSGANYCTFEMSIKTRGLLPAADKEREALIDSITPAEVDSD